MVKTTNEANRLRSAKAPVMSAGVIAANINWNGEQDERDAAGRAVRLVHREADVHEADVLESAEQPETPTGVGRERDREADQDPDDAHDRQPEAVHDRGQDVLAPDEPAVEGPDPGA